MCSLHVLGKCKELINFHMFRKYLVSTKGRPGIVHYHWHKGKITFIKVDNYLFERHNYINSKGVHVSN